MPLRVDDDGALVEAYYDPWWVRVGKPGERQLPAVRHSLGGWEDGDELVKFIAFATYLGTKHFRSKGIGAEGVQWVLDWAGIVSNRLGLDTTYVVCDAAATRNVILKPRYITDDERLLAHHACTFGCKWYQGEHGNAWEHQQGVVNALTLSFRL